MRKMLTKGAAMVAALAVFVVIPAAAREISSDEAGRLPVLPQHLFERNT